MYQDKNIVCKDCGNTFVFEAGEQEFYAQKGFENEPTRCRECRSAKKNSRRTRESFTTTCAECGKEAVVPFKPNNEKPVYCSECFSNRQN